ncbi:spore germination protein GerPE [Paenibacillus sp. KN14-4R]|uniref:spore germination protein GerPE n=1 Tax=Paenibacillus sp. KN14-4R TaxID=3445773 RepID=UPI003F9F158C
MERVSCVNCILIENISGGCTFICGDSGYIRAYSQDLALQREVAVFFEDEGEYADYSVFSRNIPQVDQYGDVCMVVNNECSRIKVNRIKVIAIAAASAFQVGSNIQLDLECRRKHIRQFVTDIPPEEKKKKQMIVINK